MADRHRGAGGCTGMDFETAQELMRSRDINGPPCPLFRQDGKLYLPEEPIQRCLYGIYLIVKTVAAYRKADDSGSMPL